MTILRTWLVGMALMATCWLVGCSNGAPSKSDAALSAGAGGGNPASSNPTGGGGSTGAAGAGGGAGVTGGGGAAGGGGTLGQAGAAGQAGATGAGTGEGGAGAAGSTEDGSVAGTGGGAGGSSGSTGAAGSGGQGENGAGGGGGRQGGDAGVAGATGAGGGSWGSSGGQSGTVASWWPTAYDANGTPSPSDGHHQDGESCLSCHTGAGEAPAWLFGGTLYNASGTSGQAHVEVGIRDGVQFYSAFSGENGNVWAPQGSSSINWDNAEIRLRNAGGETLMPSKGDNGDCNHCHDSKLRIIVP
jgi:hypothetical protein